MSTTIQNLIDKKHGKKVIDVVEKLSESHIRDRQLGSSDRIRRDVPMFCVPFFADQIRNAKMIEALEAGLSFTKSAIFFKADLNGYMIFAAKFGGLPEKRMPMLGYMQHYLLDIIIPALLIILLILLVLLYMTYRFVKL
ncbi:hypothetical protein L596_013402 [Steinernema carpocapsae]|nr:hypothetical protein L596_013402 [Steinernema carpocapsae]